MNDHSDAVTCWISDVRRGCLEAQRRIFDRYFGSAVRLADRKLGPIRRREADEEDIAISAMQSLFGGVASDRFARLDARRDLWALLAVITSRKAIRQMRRLMSRKHGLARERGESVFAPDGDGLSAMADQADHELHADARDLGHLLLQQLPDPMLRSVAVLRLEGLST